MTKYTDDAVRLLATAIHSVAIDLVRTRRKLGKMTEDKNDLEDQLDEAIDACASESDRLYYAQLALKKYGRHLTDCDIYTQVKPPFTCSCGLHTVLRPEGTYGK